MRQECLLQTLPGLRRHFLFSISARGWPQSQVSTRESTQALICDIPASENVARRNATRRATHEEMHRALRSQVHRVDVTCAISRFGGAARAGSGPQYRWIWN